MGLFDRVIPDVKGRVVGFVLEYLGQYLDGLDKKQVKLKLWQGDLSIENVQLKPAALDDLLQDNLKLPWGLAWGKVKVLRLKVPWSSLKKDSVVVSLDGIEVIAMPQKGRPSDCSKKVLRQKEKRLAEWESSRITSSQSDKENSPKQKSSWFQKLKSAVIENIKFEFKNISIRYEDAITNPQSPIALGLTLSAVSMCTSTSSWEDTFINNSLDDSCFKLLHLKELSLFISPNINIDNCCTIPRGLALLAAGRNSDLQKIKETDCIIKQVSCDIRLEMQREGHLTNKKPSAKIDITAPELNISLSQQQYTALLSVVREIQNGCESSEIIARVRPPPFCRPILSPEPAMKNMGFTSDAKAWWKYAIYMVKQQLKPTQVTSLLPQQTLPSKPSNGNNELLGKYVALHSKATSSAGLSEEEQVLYDSLHEYLAFEELIASRTAVYAAQSKGSSAKKPQKKESLTTTTTDTPVQYEKGSTVWTVNATLKKCAVTLSNDEGTLLVVELIKSKLSLFGKPEGLKLITSVGNISIVTSSTLSEDKDRSDEREEASSPLFYFELEQYPVCLPDTSIQMRCKLQPVMLVCDFVFISSLTSFFSADANAVSEFAIMRATAQDRMVSELDSIKKQQINLSVELLKPTLVIQPRSEHHSSLVMGCSCLSICDVPVEGIGEHDQRISFNISDCFASSTTTVFNSIILHQKFIDVSDLNTYLVGPVLIKADVMMSENNYSVAVSVKSELVMDISMLDIKNIESAFNYSEESTQKSTNRSITTTQSNSLSEPNCFLNVDLCSFKLKLNHGDGVVSVLSASDAVFSLKSTSQYVPVHVSASLNSIIIIEENNLDDSKPFIDVPSLTISVNCSERTQQVIISSRSCLNIIINDCIVRFVEFLYRVIHYCSTTTENDIPNQDGENNFVVDVDVKQASLTIFSYPMEIGSMTCSGRDLKLLITSYADGIIISLEEIKNLLIFDNKTKTSIATCTNSSSLKADTTKDHTVMLSIAVDGPDVNFFFRQFDRLIDTFTDGYLKRLIDVSDMFDPIPMPISTSKKPPNVSLTLTNPKAKIPISSPTSDDVFQNLPTVSSSKVTVSTQYVESQEFSLTRKITIFIENLGIAGCTVLGQEPDLSLKVSTRPQFFGLELDIDKPVRLRLRQNDIFYLTSVFKNNFLAPSEGGDSSPEEEVMSICMKNVIIVFEEMSPTVMPVSMAVGNLKLLSNTLLNKDKLHEISVDAVTCIMHEGPLTDSRVKFLSQPRDSTPTMLLTRRESAADALVRQLISQGNQNPSEAFQSRLDSPEVSPKLFSDELTILKFSSIAVKASHPFGEIISVETSVDEFNVVLSEPVCGLIQSVASMFPESSEQPKPANGYSATLKIDKAELTIANAACVTISNQHCEIDHSNSDKSSEMIVKWDCDTASASTHSSSHSSVLLLQTDSSVKEVTFITRSTPDKIETEINSKLGSISVVVVSDVINEISRILNLLPFKKTTTATTTTTTPTPTELNVTCSIVSLTLLVPVSLECSSQFIQCSVNEIIIRLKSNKLSADLNGLIATCDAEDIITPISLQLLLDMTTTAVTVDVPEVRVTLTPQTLAIVIGVFKRNLSQININSNNKVQSVSTGHLENPKHLIHCEALIVLINEKITDNSSPKETDIPLQGYETVLTIEAGGLSLKQNSMILKNLSIGPDVLQCNDLTNTFLTVGLDDCDIIADIAPISVSITPLLLNVIVGWLDDVDELLSYCTAVVSDSPSSFKESSLSTTTASMITIVFQGLLISLSHHGDILLTSNISVSKVTCDSLFTSGTLTLGNIQVFDFEDNEVVGLTSPEKENLITLTYQQKEGINGNIHDLSITMHSLKVVFIASLAAKIHSALQGGIRDKLVETRQKLKQEATAVATSKIQLSLRVEHPNILIPEIGTDKGIRLDLGLLLLSNSPAESGNTDLFSASLKDCLILSFSNMILKSPINVDASIKKVLINKHHASLEIFAQISPIDLSLTLDEWHRILRIISSNLLQISETDETEFTSDCISDQDDRCSESFRQSPEDTRRVKSFIKKKPSSRVDVNIKASLPSLTVSKTTNDIQYVLCKFTKGTFLLQHSTCQSVTDTYKLSVCSIEIADLLDVSDFKFDRFCESDFVNNQFSCNTVVTFKPEYIHTIMETVVIPVRCVMLGRPPLATRTINTITLSDNSTLTEDLILSHNNILHVSSSKYNSVTLEAGGHSIYLKNKSCIRIDEGVLFSINQSEIILCRNTNLGYYVKLGGPNSGFLADPMKNKITSEKIKTKEKIKEKSIDKDLGCSPVRTPIEKKWVSISPTIPPACPSTPSETLAESLRRVPLDSLNLGSPVRSVEQNNPFGTFRLTSPAIPQSKVIKFSIKTNIKIILSDDLPNEPNIGEYESHEQRALIVSFKGIAADINSRISMPSGVRNNTLSTISVAAFNVTRRNIDPQTEFPTEASLVQRTRCDVYYREDTQSPTGVEILCGSISVRVAISDILYSTKILKKIAAVRHDSALLATSGKPLQHHNKYFNDDNSNSGFIIECDIPGISICVIDDCSVSEVHLPLFEGKIRDLKLMVAIESTDEVDTDPDYRMRLSFSTGISHYNHTKCEFETVLEEAPIGIELQQSPTFDASVGQLRFVLTAVTGLKFALSPVTINTLRSLKGKFQNQTSFQSQILGSHSHSSDDMSGSIDHSRLHKYPTRIENSLPFPVTCSLPGQKKEITVPVLGTQSMFGGAVVEIKNPVDGASHRVDTSILGFRPLSSDVLVNTKLSGGVKVTTILTSVTVVNTLHVNVAIKLLATKDEPELEVQLPKHECLSIVKGMLNRKIMIENSIPNLPVSEIVHNAHQRGGSVETPVMDTTVDSVIRYYVIHTVRLQSQTQLRICPSFAVTNLTGAVIQMSFYLHPDGKCILSTSFKQNDTVQLSNLDPTKPLFMTMNFQQQGGEQLSLSNKLPYQIRGNRVVSGSLKLTPEDETVTPVCLDVTFPKASGKREMQITCRYWCVNHTDFDLLLCHKGGVKKYTTTVIPGLSEHPVLVTPDLQSELVVSLRICGDPKDNSSEDLLLHHLGAEGIAVIGTTLIRYQTSWSGGEQGYRTRVIELLPYRVYLNNLDHTLYLQSGVASSTSTDSLINFTDETELPPGVSIKVNTHSSHLSLSMCKSEELISKKSCCMEIGQVSECELVMKMKSPESDDFLYMLCTVRCDGTQYITVAKTSPPFLIVNRTPLAVEMWQSGFSDQTITTDPRKTSYFGWDDSLSESSVQIRLFSKTSNKFSLYDSEALSENPVLNLPTLDIYCTVAPMKDDNTIQVTFHTDPIIESSVLKLRDSMGKLSVLNLKFDIKEVAISLVRHKEIACLTMGGLFAQLYRGFGQELLQVTLQGFQLDDMSEQQPLFPVVLCPIESAPASRPFLRLTTLRRVNYSDLIDFQHVSLWLDAVSVNIGDHFLWQLLELNREADIAVRHAPSKYHSNEYHKEKALASRDQQGFGSRRIHFDSMELGSVVLSVTVDRLIEGRDPYRDALGLGILSLALPSVKDCHLALSGVVITNGRDTVGMLVKRCRDNYTQQIEASRNFIGFIGRIPVFGNPLGLFTNISTGVKDFFILPAIGLTRSPFDFGSGIIKGTGSLVGKSFGGVFGTVAGLTRGGARIIESVTDEDWRTKRSQLTKTSPHTLESTVKGVFDGIVGVVKDPVMGAMRGGAVGGIVGIGKGILGAVAKPISGVLHDVSETATLLEKTLLVKSTPLRIRPPKYFANESEGQTAGVRWKEIFENQRWYAGVGWTSTVLPAVDYPSWSTKTGNLSPDKDQIKLRQSHVWTGSWHIDSTSSKEGWMYATDFTSSFHVHHHELDFVRRRRWMRAYQLACDVSMPPVEQSNQSATVRSNFIALV